MSHTFTFIGRCVVFCSTFLRGFVRGGGGGVDVGGPASSLENLRLRKSLVSTSIFAPASSSSQRFP